MALSRNHGIAEDKQVLLAHDGRLLEHQQMIGAYGVGTVGVAHSCIITQTMWVMEFIYVPHTWFNTHELIYTCAYKFSLLKVCVCLGDNANITV